MRCLRLSYFVTKFVFFYFLVFVIFFFSVHSFTWSNIKYILAEKNLKLKVQKVTFASLRIKLIFLLILDEKKNLSIERPKTKTQFSWSKNKKLKKTKKIHHHRRSWNHHRRSWNHHRPSWRPRPCRQPRTAFL